MEPLANRPDAEARILGVVRELLAETHPAAKHELKESLTLDSSLDRDLKLDSLARVELMLRIGQAFGDALPEAALAEAQTPRDILRFLGRTHADSPPQHLAFAAHAGVAGLPFEAGSLVEVLEWHALRQPDRVHVLLCDEARGEVSITYGDLLSGARKMAHGLQARGIAAGQAVALMLPTGRAYLECFFGVLVAGGIPVPIYPPARLAQIEDHLRRHAKILANSGTVLIITVAEAKPVALMLRAVVKTLGGIVTADELAGGEGAASSRKTRGEEEAFSHKAARDREGSPHRAKSAEVALLQYTSGSTGDPKGVVLTHANLLANIRAMGAASKAGGEDVFVSWLPLYHDMGLIGSWLGALYHGCPLILMSPLAFLAQPARWLAALSRHHGTISGAPNFAYELCVHKIKDEELAGLDLSHWRFAFNGAEPVNPATLEAFARRFASCGLKRTTLAPVYGLAECSVGLAFPPRERGPRIDVVLREPFANAQRAEPAAAAPAGTAAQGDVLEFVSCGRALPGHEIRIVDDAGVEVPERQVGVLEFRGPSATSGYWRNRAATALLLHDGWLNSGDYAYVAEGEVYIAGRAKDLIIRGGRNVYPYDLEQAVGKLPGVRTGCVAVFAATDAASRSERLVVLAETRSPPGEAEDDALRHRINAAALDVLGMPADEIVLAPPHTVLKTSSGKIRRAACRSAFERGELSHETAPVWLQTLRLVGFASRARITVTARRAGLWCYGIYVASLFILLAPAAGVLVRLISRPSVGRKIMQLVARAFLQLSGLRVASRGLEALPAGPHVLIVNHTSYLDIVILTALLPPDYAFVAKAELQGGPMTAAVLRALGTLFVERFDVTQSGEDVAAMVAALNTGTRLLVFPEGTLTREAGLKSFALGGFVAASRAGVPVVVAGLRGVRSVLRDETWLPRRGSIELEVGPILEPGGRDWAAAVTLAQKARAAMLPLVAEPDLA